MKMKKYSMQCSCGHVMTVDAKSREEAVSKLKATMTEEAVVAHMQEKHPGEPMLTQAQVHAGIQQGVKEGVPQTSPIV